MKKRTILEISAALVLLLGVLWFAHRATLGNAEQQGAVKAATVQLDASNDTLRAHKAKVDTVYVHDSVTYAVTRNRYDTLRVTDTIRVRDTLYVRKDIADANILACSAVLNDCERQKFVRDSIITNRDQRIADDERLATLTRHQATRDKLAWAIVSAAAGRLSCALLK